MAAHALTLLGLAAGTDAASPSVPGDRQAPVSVRVVEPRPATGPVLPESVRSAPSETASPAAMPAMPVAEAAPTPEGPAPLAPTSVPPARATASPGSQPTAPEPAAGPAVRGRTQDAAVAPPSSSRATEPAPAWPALPPAPDHHLAATLDPGPKPLADIDFVYPPEAGLHDGVVVVRLLIDEKGALTDIAVVRSQPAGMFDAAAVQAFSAARFSPGYLRGVPVKSQITAEVEFKPYNRGANVSGRGY